MEAISQLLIWIKGLFTWWVVIVPWEQGVRVLLGKRRRLLKPGVAFRLPIVHLIFKQSVRLRSSDLQLQTLTTSDGDTVAIAGAILYRITDVLKLYDTLHLAQETIVDMAAGAIAEAVHSLPRSEPDNGPACTPAAVVASVKAQLSFAEYGVELVDVYLTDFAFVRTYRLIKDDKHRSWEVENNLNTIREAPK